MARISTSLDIAAPPEKVWELVTDWPAHSRWIPMTKVTIDDGSPAAPGVGTSYTGRSAVGPVGFDDPMTVTEWQPPGADGVGRCRIVKRGPWVLGWAVIEVSPTADGTRLGWVEEMQPRWTPKFLDPVVAKVGNAMFGQALGKLKAELS